MKTTPVSALVVTDATFTAEVVAADRPVLVDFWATWCGPCRTVGPTLAALAAAHPEVKLVSVNADENPRTAAALHVLRLPTVQLWRDGKVVAEVRGARPMAGFQRAFDPHLG